VFLFSALSVYESIVGQDSILLADFQSAFSR